MPVGSPYGYCACCGAESRVEQHDSECMYYGEYDNLNGNKKIEKSEQSDKD